MKMYILVYVRKFCFCGTVSCAAIFKPADFLVKFFGGFFIDIPNLKKLTVRGILGLVIKKM